MALAERGVRQAVPRRASSDAERITATDWCFRAGSPRFCMADDRHASPRGIFDGMRKIDEYRRGMELCLINAANAPFRELRAVWQTLGNSYAFLAELESWPGFGHGSADGGGSVLRTAPIANGDGSALRTTPFNECPTDDRILP